MKARVLFPVVVKLTGEHCKSSLSENHPEDVWAGQAAVVSRRLEFKFAQEGSG